MNDYNELIQKIKELKKEKNAVCLVHNYQRPEIYEIADHIGDSLGLCREAAKTEAERIVFCGVDFMAESAKILNPDKIVLHPNKLSICPMAQMVTVQELKEKKKHFPDAVVVSYVNTTAFVKSESDICCTSANAVEVINSLKEKRIIFVPDKNLALYVQTKTDKEIIPWKGYCYVHAKISAESAKKAKKTHPKAELIVHPECKLDVIELADAVCSTSQMIDHAKKSDAEEFIIATEEGMINRLKREISNKKFYTIGGVCLQMKKITLENVYEALKKEQFEVKLQEEIRIKAKKALDKMLDLKK
jgi:quinolinate synthase